MPETRKRPRVPKLNPLGLIPVIQMGRHAVRCRAKIVEYSRNVWTGGAVRQHRDTRACGVCNGFTTASDLAPYMSDIVRLRFLELRRRTRRSGPCRRAGGFHKAVAVGDRVSEIGHTFCGAAFARGHDLLRHRDGEDLRELRRKGERGSYLDRLKRLPPTHKRGS